MYQALYRKWRPQVFSDVVGQTAVTDTLKAQVGSNRLSHAYLFSGSRGTGKTTCARILAKAINCEHPIHGDPCNACASCLGISSGEILDVIEIDAASNNGVENVRDLRDEAVYSPASVKKRVYIIDEVHMFSTNAFNALLKILEEPPEHVMFILATTEQHKIPATITSRCQRFQFKRITVLDITERLLKIALGEDRELTRDAAEQIAMISDGGMRDAIMLLDQCMSYCQGGITIDTVADVAGFAGLESTTQIILSIAEHDKKTALKVLNDVYENGRNLASVLGELCVILRDILILQTAPEAKIPLINARFSGVQIAKLSKSFETGRLLSCIQTIQETISTISGSANKRIDAELCVVKLCGNASAEDFTALSERISALEKLIASGAQKIAPATHKTEETPPWESSDTVMAEPAPKQENNNIIEDIPKKSKLNTKDIPETASNESDPKAEASDATALWKEILNAAKNELPPGYFALLCDLKPAFSDKQLFLQCDNTLAHNFLKQRSCIDTLHKYAKERLGYPIMIKAVDPNEPVKSSKDFDKFCKSLESNPIVTINP